MGRLSGTHSCRGGVGAGWEADRQESGAGREAGQHAVGAKAPEAAFQHAGLPAAEASNLHSCLHGPSAIPTHSD